MNASQYISNVAQNADLNDESSMFDALELIADAIAQGGNADQELYISCVDRDDPSQMYDALVHFGAAPIAADDDNDPWYEYDEDGCYVE